MTVSPTLMKRNTKVPPKKCFQKKSDLGLSFVDSSSNSILSCWLVPCRSKAFIQIRELRGQFDQQAVQPKRSIWHFLSKSTWDWVHSFSDFMLNKTYTNSWRFLYLYRVRSIGKSRFRFSKSKSGFPNKISVVLVMWHIAWLRYITLTSIEDSLLDM